jgi:murein DD-endopeptidase MepM/ murein hydrolase activator NlpD
MKYLALVLALLLANCAADTSPAPTQPAAVPTASSATVAAPPTLARPVQQPSPTAAPTTAPPPTPIATAAPTAALSFAYPIGAPGRPPGDGFFVRHGYQTENTWYNRGYWHTGEDWYAIEGDTAGAPVLAVADGEVAYAGANYPGRVVIVKHAEDLYSMYGHLDPALQVEVGHPVVRGQRIGTVLRRGDATPNHLHFEMRTFIVAEAVNGERPRYGFRCGVNCPPGPGYWPIDAADRPSDRGWRNPIQAINRRMLPAGSVGEVVVATRPISPSVTLWSTPPDKAERLALGTLELKPGERFSLVGVYTGPEDARDTSALAYQLWYQLSLSDGGVGWVQATVPSTFDTGSDGRPSSIYFNFFPAIDTPPRSVRRDPPGLQAGL